MPVLEPNPQNGQKKLLLVFATIIGILVVIGVIASIVAP
ncbi:SGM_5486 family transporter-associated protein [Streptomyces sp. NPDC054796]